jgi:hypothetical protein
MGRKGKEHLRRRPASPTEVRSLLPQGEAITVSEIHDALVTVLRRCVEQKWRPVVKARATRAELERDCAGWKKLAFWLMQNGRIVDTPKFPADIARFFSRARRKAGK